MIAKSKSHGKDAFAGLLHIKSFVQGLQNQVETNA